MNSITFKAFCDELSKFAGEEKREEITTKQFKSFEELRSSLKKGDIILTSAVDPYSVTKQLVHLGNPDRWHHAGLYVGKGKIVDTWPNTDPSGVHETTLRESIKGGWRHGDPAGKGLDVMVVRPKTTAKQKMEAVRIARAHIGIPYGTLRAVSMLLPPPEGKITKRQAMKKPDTVICSQVVARAYHDVAFSKKHPDWTLPQDFAASPKVRVVGAYVRG